MVRYCSIIYASIIVKNLNSLSSTKLLQIWNFHIFLILIYFFYHYAILITLLLYHYLFVIYHRAHLYRRILSF